MSSIKIVADSTCDLSPELIRDYGITILPLNIVLDMTSYSDGEEISPDEIYVWAQANKRTPKTAAVAFDRALALVKGMKENQEEVIFIGISSEMSTTCNAERLRPWGRRLLRKCWAAHRRRHSMLRPWL